MEASDQHRAPGTKVMHSSVFFLDMIINHLLIKCVVVLDQDKNISADLPVVSG
jgi:hypothetical protein